MNNRYLTALFCITVLAFAPACTKRSTSAKSLHPTHKASEYTVGGHSKTTPKQDDVNTMIELDNAVFEIEEDIDTQKSIIKF